MQPRVVYEPEKGRILALNAQGQPMAVYALPTANLSDLPPGIQMLAPPDAVKADIDAYLAGDQSKAQIAQAHYADLERVLVGIHAADVQAGTAAPESTAALAQTPQYVNAWAGAAQSARTMLEANHKLDQGERGLRATYEKLGIGTLFDEDFATAKGAANMGQPPTPQPNAPSESVAAPERPDEPTTALLQDPANVVAYTNLGDETWRLAAFQREKMLDDVQARLADRQLNMDRTKAFQTAQEGVQKAKDDRFDAGQSEMKASIGNKLGFTGDGGWGNAYETGGKPVDYGGLAKLDKNVADKEKAYWESYRTLAPREAALNYRREQLSDPGKSQALQPHQRAAFDQTLAVEEKYRTDKGLAPLTDDERTPQQDGWTATHWREPQLFAAGGQYGGSSAYAPDQRPQTPAAPRPQQTSAPTPSYAPGAMQTSAPSQGSSPTAGGPYAPGPVSPSYAGEKDNSGAFREPVRFRPGEESAQQAMQQIAGEKAQAMAEIDQELRLIGQQLQQGMAEIAARESQGLAAFTQRQSQLQQQRQQLGEQHQLELTGARSQGGNQNLALLAQRKEALGRNPMASPFLPQVPRAA